MVTPAATIDCKWPAAEVPVGVAGGVEVAGDGAEALTGAALGAEAW